MITVQQERCSGCNLCEAICHEDSIRCVNGSIQVDHELCDSCTQCIAVCPSRALAWEGIKPVAYDRSLMPSVDQLLELFKERRSIRKFKKQPIDRQLLAEIATCGVYAPTHNQVFKVIIVDDPTLLAALNDSVFSINKRIYKLGYQIPLIGILARLLGFGDEYLKAKPKLEAAIQQGSVFSSQPVAFIIIVGSKKVALGEASAQYALANMMYYAQVKGIGACLWGNAPIFVEKDKRIRERLGLQKHERIYGALYMGYPAIKFSNKVLGKALPIQWNEVNVHRTESSKIYI